MKGLNGTAAIVTGAAGRIGKAVVRRLVGYGVRVAAADINAAGAKALADELGEQVLPVQFDAGDPESIKAMVEQAFARFGRLDILHNNAALTNLGDLGADGTVLDTSIDLLDRMMDVNVKGYFVACRYAIPLMLKNGGGKIINMTSNAALGGDHARVAYGISKGAISVLTKYIATQHGREGIRCNAISPGLIADDELKAMIPKFVAIHERNILGPRVGHPDDIASLVAFLSSSESAFIQGQIISIDGGLNAHQPTFSDSMSLETPFS